MFTEIKNIDYFIIAICMLNLILQLYLTIKNNNSACKGQIIAKRRIPNGGSYQKEAHLTIQGEKDEPLSTSPFIQRKKENNT